MTLRMALTRPLWLSQMTRRTPAIRPRQRKTTEHSRGEQVDSSTDVRAILAWAPGT